MKYCPHCGGATAHKPLDGRERLQCAEDCGFVHWDNPVPVVAAIVEYQNKVLLARNARWPKNWYALVTGYLECGETPEEGVVRELKEETGLDGQIAGFVGNYTFHEQNQLLIVFHIQAEGTIRLSEELADYKLLEKHRVVPWDRGTGPALKDWLVGQLGGSVIE